MKSSTVNISFNDDLLRQIDEIAEKESRSRSELIREAARGYIERKRRWEKIFAYGREVARAKGLTPKDVERAIAAHRTEKRR
jgi:metal-responsive CopG/Arc/MetJ family transcriptional regulator